MPTNEKGFSPLLLFVGGLTVFLIVVGATYYIFKNRQQQPDTSPQQTQSSRRFAPRPNSSTIPDETHPASPAASLQKSHITHSFQLLVNPAWQVDTQPTNLGERTLFTIPGEDVPGADISVYINKFPVTDRSKTELEEGYIDLGYKMETATVNGIPASKFTQTTETKHTPTVEVDAKGQQVAYVVQHAGYVYTIGYDYFGAHPGPKEEAYMAELLKTLSFN